LPSNLRRCTVAVSGAEAQQFLPVEAVPGRWSVEQANAWHAKQPWLVGCNDYRATAMNQIDMRQSSTLDTVQTKNGLGWAESIGMNTRRVYLPD